MLDVGSNDHKVTSVQDHQISAILRQIIKIDIINIDWNFRCSCNRFVATNFLYLTAYDALQKQ